MGQPPIKAITEAADAVTTATKALWDHINSLAGEQRDKAIAYQQRLRLGRPFCLLFVLGPCIYITA